MFMLTLKHKNRDSQIKPAETQISSQVLSWFCLNLEVFVSPLKNIMQDLTHEDWSWVLQS